MADEKLLSIEDIEKANDTRYETVPIPEWNGSIRLGSLSADDLIAWSEKNGDPASSKVAGVRLLVASMVDGADNRIGTDATVATLRKKDAKILTDLVKRALALNGLSEKAVEERKNGSGEASAPASPTVLH